MPPRGRYGDTPSSTGGGPGANGIVGAGYAIAAGAALTAKRSGSGRVAVCFFGDGAITRGTFHEVMNMASLWKLPLLMVCENNGYAQYVATTETMVFRCRGTSRRARMHAERPGHDVLAHDEGSWKPRSRRPPSWAPRWVPP